MGIYSPVDVDGVSAVVCHTHTNAYLYLLSIHCLYTLLYLSVTSDLNNSLFLNTHRHTGINIFAFNCHFDIYVRVNTNNKNNLRNIVISQIPIIKPKEVAQAYIDDAYLYGYIKELN